MTARKMFVYLAVLEGMVAAPLAVFLPVSGAALVVAVVVLVALNASVLATIAARTWSLPLQVSNLAMGGIFLWAAFGPGMGSWAAWAATIGALYLCLFVLGLFQLSDRMLKECFAAQQLALASTLVSWLAIRHFWPAFEASGLTSAEHFRAGLRFLFLGPLALVVFTYFAGLAGWRGFFTAMAGVCAAQWGMGFIELGAALGSYPLVIAGLILATAFLLLLVLAVAFRRRPIKRNSV